jgi:ubiquitin C-terminal hydrolase
MNNNNFGMPNNNFNSNNNQNNSNMNNNNFGMPMSNFNGNHNQMNNNINMGNQISSPMIKNNNEVKYSFSRYTKAPKTSLKKLVETSYLNAVLQIFATNRTISSYFVNPTNKTYFETNKASFPFTYVFHRLFTHFYPYPENKYCENYSPDVLLDVLGRYNKVYKSKKSRNPIELLNFILITLHKELNTQKTKFISEPDPTNKKQVLKEGLEDFQKSNKSIISNNFHWFELKSKNCCGCNLIYYYFSNYETFDLDILGTFQKFNSAITIFHCLNYQREKNQNSYCKKCQSYKQFKINTRIYSSPISFIFTLNRGNPDQNLLNINFMIEKTIDIGIFLENENAYKQYELSGVVSFSVNENKYVCFGKSPVDKQWYLYNDETVEDMDINSVLTNNNSMQYIPCILFYHYMK